MVALPLANGFFGQIDLQDVERVSRYLWYLHPSELRAQTRLGRSRFIDLHRFIANPKPGQVVVPLNGDKLDARRSNLFVGTRTQAYALRYRVRFASRYRRPDVPNVRLKLHRAAQEPLSATLDDAGGSSPLPRSE